MHGYVYSALNRLEKAWGAAGTEAEYIYNGLGQRTGRKTEEKQEDYVLDLTRAYHNLLEVEKGKGSQQFYWDFGAAAMEEKGRAPRYYLADELGSPLRVLYGNGNGEVYGYDEFGGELYEAPDPEKEAEARYSRQGGRAAVFFSLPTRLRKLLLFQKTPPLSCFLLRHQMLE